MPAEALRASPSRIWGWSTGNGCTGNAQDGNRWNGQEEASRNVGGGGGVNGPHSWSDVGKGWGNPILTPCPVVLDAPPLLHGLCPSATASTLCPLSSQGHAVIADFGVATVLPFPLPPTHFHPVSPPVVLPHSSHKTGQIGSHPASHSSPS